MIKSSLLNYELPNSSINQEPYENPLDSKLLIAKKVPKGNPIIQDNKRDIPLTFSERKSISIKLSSKFKTRSNALFNASRMIFIFISFF